MPLPKGRVRMYRRDTDGQLEFIGEDEIDHTPADETLRLYSGNAFDIVGERKRTDFKTDTNARTIDESFEITLRNHKKTPVDVTVVEHLFRWSNWEITRKSDPFTQKNSQTVECRVQIATNEEKKIFYTVHYSW